MPLASEETGPLKAAISGHPGGAPENDCSSGLCPHPPGSVPPGPHFSLSVNDAGALLLLPIGTQPRLERALATSPATGMLDLLRYGPPAGADAALRWLHSRIRERAQLFLRALRRGDDHAAALLCPTPTEAARWLESLPPLAGAPVSAATLCAWFSGLLPALERAAAHEACTVEEWLSRLGEGWRQLGHLCFHLAENAGENAHEQPFAFLATFIHTVGQDGKPRHAPLGLAPRLLANDRAALLALLYPLREAARQSPFLAELIDSQSVYRPCAWSARQAYSFLEATPQLEACGIETRMVNLWKTLPPRVELEVKLELAEGGEGKPDKAPALNIHSLLRFLPHVALGAQQLSEEELRELLAGDDDGLVRFRGEWVRLDREKLARLLDNWRQAARLAAGGIPLLAGLRYLLGKRSQALPQLPPPEDGVRVSAGEALASALEKLHLAAREPELPPALAATLRPYQREGVRFLLSVTEAGFGACLADDMGLGKTLQLIAWLCDLHQRGVLNAGAALIIAPASLLANWREELARFAPLLVTTVLHPYALSAADAALMQREPARLLSRAHVALTTYGMATRNGLLARCALPALVLDEAQAIKNADSQRTRALLRLQSPRRVALTGTPVENGLSELHSLFEFLNPGLLGDSKDFNAMVRQMGSDYAPLRRLIRPFVLRRLKSDPALLPELPPKTEQAAWGLLTPEQARLYAREVEHLQAVIAEPDPQTRLALVLPLLGRFKQICNHPAQYLGEPAGSYDPAQSGKMLRLGHLAREIAAAGDACLIFTQYRTLIDPLHDFLAGIFGAPGLTLHGGTPLGERQQHVAAFQQAGGPRFFVLSLKAAGTGLTLTRARHVIHFDRWWNPAVENQASDRAYRIGQKNPVIIHPLICRGTIEENIHHMLRRKTAMADALLAGGLEKMLLSLSGAELMDLVATPTREA